MGKKIEFKTHSDSHLPYLQAKLAQVSPNSLGVSNKKSLKSGMVSLVEERHCFTFSKNPYLQLILIFNWKTSSEGGLAINSSLSPRLVPEMIFWRRSTSPKSFHTFLQSIFSQINFLFLTKFFALSNLGRVPINRLRCPPLLLHVFPRIWKIEA